MTPSFISVHPGGRTKRYRKHGRRWERTNPILTGEQLALAAGGVGLVGIVGYLIWRSQQASSPVTLVVPPIVPVALLAPLPVGSPYTPGPVPPPGGTVPQVTPTGTFMWTGDLPNGYRWKDQGNTQVPAIGSTIQAIVAYPSGVMNIIYGQVLSASLGGSAPCPPGAMCSMAAWTGGCSFKTMSELTDGGSLPSGTSAGKPMQIVVAQGTNIFLPISYVKPSAPPMMMGA